jgi:hypothetical protein
MQTTLPSMKKYQVHLSLKIDVSWSSTPPNGTVTSRSVSHGPFGSTLDDFASLSRKADKSLSFGVKSPRSLVSPDWMTMPEAMRPIQSSVSLLG